MLSQNILNAWAKIIITKNFKITKWQYNINNKTDHIFRDIFVFRVSKKRLKLLLFK